jgi:hypothetical protein
MYLFLIAGGALSFIHVELILNQRLSPRSQKLQEKFGINLTQLPRVPPSGVEKSNSVVNGPSKKTILVENHTFPASARIEVAHLIYANEEKYVLRYILIPVWLSKSDGL